MDVPFIFKDLFYKEVQNIGTGMCNSHAHIDRAFTITPELWEQASVLMERKWILMRDLKQSEEYFESMEKRFDLFIEAMIAQGVVATRTHVDADSIVGMRVVEIAAKMREKYKDKFTLQLVAHPLEGFLNADETDFDQTKIELFEKACDICDVVGGLPSRDRKLKGGDGFKKHADMLFTIAKNLGKDMDVHTDQENNPLERDSETMLDKLDEHNYHGHLTLVHAVSVAAQPGEYRQSIIKRMADSGTNVSVCPRAAIGMKQHIDKTGPIHNSIAPVVELIEGGVNVSLGTDNVSDMFIPNSNGDMWDEVNLLADAVRLYDVKKLAELATLGGFKTMKLDPQRTHKPIQQWEEKPSKESSPTTNQEAKVNQ